MINLQYGALGSHLDNQIRIEAERNACWIGIAYVRCGGSMVSKLILPSFFKQAWNIFNNRN